MANPNGRKGSSWEAACRDFLKPWWPKMDRKTKTGAKDEGDLTHPENWAVECKNVNPISLPRFLREAEAEAGHKGVRLFVALVKNRRSKGESGRVEDGYAVTRTRVWAEVARQHEIGTELVKYLAALNARDLPDSSYRVLANEAVRMASDDWYGALYGNE